MMNSYLPNYQNYPNYLGQYQPVQVQPNSLVSKIVDDFTMITANEVPMDGNPAIFMKRDLSEIQTRKWGADGRIYMTSYKSHTDDLSNNMVNVSSEPKQSEYDALTERLRGIEEKIDKIIKPTTAKKGVADANT